MPAEPAVQDALSFFLAPRSVAVIGASERPGSVGLALFSNLMAQGGGASLYAVNAKRQQVLGQPAFARIGQVPTTVDLALIAVPAEGVPQLVRECAQAGVKAALVISAGFRETGPPGEKLEKAVADALQGSGMRLMGPNCLGVMAPSRGFNASFARTVALKGSVAFVSQSGALLSGVLDWSLRKGFGFSAALSLGSMLDIGWGEAIESLGKDPATRSILLYMESIGDARSFLRACAQVAPRKPIILLKSGRSEAGVRAAASHTGALMTSDAVLDAALRRCGVVRVDTVAELFAAAEALDLQPRPQGPRLAVLTNAGGPGVLAADALEQGGGELAQLSKESLKALDRILPAHWSHADPVDLLGDATPERYRQAVEIVYADPGCDGLLVVLTPQFMTDPDAVAQALVDLKLHDGKPVYTSFLGGPAVAQGAERLKAAGIPSFAFPDAAARLYCRLWQYRSSSSPELAPPPGPMRPQPMLQATLAAGHTLLSEQETKAMLAAYAIPVTPCLVASDPGEAVAAADKLGYPVVLKLHSHSVTHKGALGGVKLSLKDAAEVQEAFVAIQASVSSKAGPAAFEGVSVQRMESAQAIELILGCSVDPQFGPVLLLGLGGSQVELRGGGALALPPLDDAEALAFIQRSPVAKLLKDPQGGKALDPKALAACVSAFSRLVLENPRIKEVEMNPLLAGPQGVVALDARALLHPVSLPDADLPRAALPA